MEYNTASEKLILHEYGRNIQKLVKQAVQIEDEKEREKFVNNIIYLMGKMYPYLRDLRDFKHKLWDHLVIMSDFKLKEDSPYPVPATSTFDGEPEKIPYGIKNFRYKHFGKNILDMLNYAADLEDGEEKTLLTALLANHMKKLYLTWSKDIVADDFIFQKITELTNGKLVVNKDLVLSDSGSLVNKQQQQRKRKKDSKYSGKKDNKYSKRRSY
ncbi:MAG: DUF4290 domain-containing protein [Bacteroidales bacterium]|nr:DUF4290 domain-containing protein [Bacteroidales bacterium]